MLERWLIESSPIPEDPIRHRLFLKGDSAEMYAILRRFGALCGRPEKTSKEDFNFKLDLRQADPNVLKSLEEFLSGLQGPFAAPAPAAPAPPPAEAVSLPAAPAPPVSVPGPAAVAVSSVGNIILPAMPAPPAAVSKPEPVAPQPALTLTAPPATPTPEPRVRAPENTPLPASREREPLWGALLELDPSRTFESLVIGSFNRFAHAAATAVISSPGSMYNPLLFYGVPGNGKSHFLQAIAHRLLENSGEKSVFVTTGPKICRAVDSAVSENRFGELLAYAEGSMGLAIEDVHLINFTEQAQSGLRSLLHHYLDGGKPILLTSAYPPRALQFLEETLDFQINSGYAVEIKQAGMDVQVQVIKSVLGRSRMGGTEEEAKALLSAMGGNLLDVNPWMRKLKAMKAIQSLKQVPADLKETLSLVAVPDNPSPAGVPTHVDLEGEMTLLAALKMSRAQGAKKVGMIAPAGQEIYGRYSLMKIRDAAQGWGLSLDIQSIEVKEYDSNQILGIPAAIGDFCRGKGLAAALVVGPAPQTQLSMREGELRHAVLKILENLNMAAAWIPFTGVQDPKMQLHAMLDLYFGLWAPWQP